MVPALQNTLAPKGASTDEPAGGGAADEPVTPPAPNSVSGTTIPDMLISKPALSRLREIGARHHFSTRGG